MRTETRTYNVYKVDELSFTAKENAYNRWLAGYEYPWQNENMATLKAFEGIFNIRVYDWRYDGCTCYYRFTSNYSEEEEELCGVRLLKFIVNHTVELTDEEKAEARQQAIRQYQAEELRKLQNRNKAKASQKTNVQQVELSLF